MRTGIFFLVYCVCSLFIVSSCSSDDEVVTPVDPVIDETPEGYALVWADEFNGDAINFEYWNHELGDGTSYGLPAGWGNNELQLYTDQAAHSGIDKTDELSALRITAVEESAGAYRSAKLTSQNKISVAFLSFLKF